MRVKSVVYTRQRKKKWFRRAKGAYASKSTRWRMVIQHLEKSMRYMYVGRKDKKRDLRAIWIQRINAVARQNDLSYSRFMNGLKNAGVLLDRKILADMSLNDPKTFAELAQLSKDNQKKVAVA
jgi:large subunit ribosomal protein L20